MNRILRGFCLRTRSAGLTRAANGDADNQNSECKQVLFHDGLLLDGTDSTTASFSLHILL